jgi:hypothetical protein
MTMTSEMFAIRHEAKVVEMQARVSLAIHRPMKEPRPRPQPLTPEQMRERRNAKRRKGRKMRACLGPDGTRYPSTKDAGIALNMLSGRIWNMCQRKQDGWRFESPYKVRKVKRMKPEQIEITIHAGGPLPLQMRCDQEQEQDWRDLFKHKGVQVAHSRVVEDRPPDTTQQPELIS